MITIHETVTMQRAAQVAVGSFQVDMMDEEPATPLWQIVLPILFIIGMMVTLVHTLSSLFRIIRIGDSRTHPLVVIQNHQNYQA